MARPWSIGPAVSWSPRVTLNGGSRRRTTSPEARSTTKATALLTGAAADLYIAGDHHVWTLQQDEAEHNGRIFWTARARGYKILDAYAEQLGYQPQQHGHSITAICDSRDGSMQCFASLPHAAKYLAYLQQAKRAA